MVIKGMHLLKQVIEKREAISWENQLWFELWTFWFLVMHADTLIPLSYIY